MSRASQRRYSHSSDSDDDSDFDRRHAPSRSRRAASMTPSRRPRIEPQGSYHRTSSERRYYSPDDSTSDSDSDKEYRRLRRSRDNHSRGRQDQHTHQSSRASSRRSTPSPPRRHQRSRSVDVNEHHRSSRGRSPSSSRAGSHAGRPSMHRRSSSAEPAPSKSQKPKGHYPPSASRTPKQRSHNTWPLPDKMADRLPHIRPPRPVRKRSDVLLAAGRTAVEAGAMAALKLKDDPTPWFGTKGAKVVAAGLSAACVDTFMERKHPQRKGGLTHTALRQATNFAIGNLVVKPVEKGKVKVPQPPSMRRRRSTRSGREEMTRDSSRGSTAGSERRRR